jgi:hypothetical protein
MYNSIVISVAIDRPFDEVYDFLAEPMNFPTWASNLGDTFEQINETDWATKTRNGRTILRFARRNGFGVLDHAVFAEGETPVTIPMRLVRNEGGTQLIYTLFQAPGMDDAAFRSEAEWITSDFNALKAMLEARSEFEVTVRDDQAAR